MTIASVPTGTSLFGGPLRKTNRVPLQAAGSSSTADEVAKMSAVTLISTARALGFVFSRLEDERILVTPPSKPGPNSDQIIAITRRLHDPSGWDIWYDVAAASLSPSGLKSPPPKPPRKIGSHPITGQVMTLPALPPPPPPPEPVTVSKGLTAVDSLSPAEMTQECDSICTEYAWLQRKLVALGDEQEGESCETQSERWRLLRRIGFLRQRSLDLEARRQRELFQHIDKCAAERRLAQDGGPRLVTNWSSGRQV